jgi:RNA polymerase sigma factor (sigma-70 family)
MGARDLEEQGADWVTGAYRAHARALQKFFSRRLSKEHDIGELTQEVWARLCRVRDPARIREPLAFLFGVANHVLAQFHLERGRSIVAFDAESALEAADHAALEQGDELAAGADSERELIAMLSMLSDTYREIVLLRLCDGLSYAEIGTRLGLSARTTEEYFFRALSKLRAAERL